MSGILSLDVDWIALAVFSGFFLLVTVMGFLAAGWRRAESADHLDEWAWAAGISARGSRGSSSAAISTPPIP